MNYYRWAQRNSAGYVAKSFEQFWPDPVVRRAVCRLLARFIEAAASVTPAWTVVLDPGVVKLDVGGVQLLDLTAKRAWFCATYTSGLPRWIERTDGGARNPVYNRVPIPSLGLLMEPNAIRRLPAEIRSAGLEYVRHAGSRWKGRSPWARANSPGVIQFLNAYLGTRLDLGYKPASAATLGGVFLEGAPTQRTSIVPERDAGARMRCLELYGHRCTACNVLLSEVYGPIALSLVHVHHLHPLGSGRQRRTDPAHDLRPLCPNCHSVAHLKQPPLSIEEIRTLLIGHRNPPSIPGHQADG